LNPQLIIDNEQTRCFDFESPFRKWNPDLCEGAIPLFSILDPFFAAAASSVGASQACARAMRHSVLFFFSHNEVLRLEIQRLNAGFLPYL
jgi:hypothetical protein